MRPLRLVANSTLPSVLANSVWSVPMPTLAPGCHLVPRWRARMLPASTCCPPYLLMPSRRPAVSRPLRDEPPAFLCAMVSGPWRSASGAENFLDAHRRLVLAVAALATRVLAPALLEGDDLGGAALLDHLGHHLGARDRRLAELGLARARQHQNLGELHPRPGVARHLLDGHHL